MKKFSSIPVVFVLCVLLVGVVGCPTSPTAEQTFEEIPFDFTYDLKGFCLFWFRDTIILNPDDIIIAIPHMSSFSFPNGLVGFFGINNDQSGRDEFNFPIVGNGNFAFIDFDQNGNLNGDDIRIDWNQAQRSFQILNHPFGGLGVQPGFYYIRFIPGLITFNDDEPCWDVNVTMRNNNLTVERNKVLCMDACILPHLVDGEGAGLVIDTDTILYNPNPAGNTVEVNFFNQDGTPADVTIDGTTASTHTFNLAANASLRVRPDLGGNIKVVWGIASGTLPVDCALDFRTLTSGSATAQASDRSLRPLNGEEFSGEAGISSGEPNTRHVLNVVRQSNANREIGVNTAIAIANPTSSNANVTLTLLDGNDTQVAQNPLADDPLGPRNQVAKFLDDLFPAFNVPVDFEGTLLVTSDTEVVVLSLQTNGSGVQQASLPSGNRRVP